MKCILYISKIKQDDNGSSIPVGFGALYYHARRANIAKGITGVLTYKDGYYLQIIEGNEAEVNKLYGKILVDSRHDNIKELVNTTITKRLFPPKLSMKIVVPQGKELSEFNDVFSSLTNTLDDTTLALYKKFIDVKNIDDGVLKIKENTFDGSLLKLNGWPDLNSFEPSPSFIDMCAKLTNSACEYETFITEEMSDIDIERLNNTLLKLHTLGLLEIIKSTDKQYSKPPTEANKPATNKKFYNKMKKFLRLGR